MDDPGKLEGKDFTATTLAAAAGVDKSYVARLCRQGIIPAVKLSPTIWLIHYADGSAWLAQRESRRQAQSNS